MQTFSFHLRVEVFKAAEQRDGQYVLRTNLTDTDPAVLWQRYMLLTEIEAAFKCLKGELALRPIYHRVEERVEAHIFVAFLAYAVNAMLKKRLEVHAPGLTSRVVLEQLAGIQMLDVHLPTTDGRVLILPRYTQPEKEQQILLNLLRMELPTQPPPRICCKKSKAEVLLEEAVL